MKSPSSPPSAWFAVIGDLVGSRRVESRARAQTDLLTALEITNRHVPAEQPMEATIGDEFQGVYASATEALRASLVVRLALPEDMDCRSGIGRGELEVVGASRHGLTQDGPAWWTARSAVEEAKRMQKRHPGVRTWLDLAGDPDQGRYAAYALCRDQVVSSFGGRQRRIALAMLAGEAQKTIAEREGISASAVSQTVRSHGIATLLLSMTEVAA